MIGSRAIVSRWAMFSEFGEGVKDRNLAVFKIASIACYQCEEAFPADNFLLYKVHAVL